MLSFFRSSSNSLFMTIVLGAIIFAFVFTFGSWGGGDLSGDSTVAATVNGRPVPQSAFEQAYTQLYRSNSMRQPGYTPEKARAEGLPNAALDGLVGNELLAQAAESRGLVIGDAELKKSIKDRLFGSDKPFDKDEYARIVQGTFRTSEARFEDQQRRALLADRMRSVIVDGIHVSDANLTEQYLDQNTKAELEFVKVDPAYWRTRITEPSADETKAWASANKPEVEKFYNEHMPRYRQPRKVEARHILVKVTEDAPSADHAAAKAKIDAAKKRLAAGEDFAKVATDVSEDSSKSSGGSLGVVGPNQMVPPFEQALFALAKGAVSDMVTTKFGYHLIKAENIQEPVTKELAVAETEIAKELMRERALKDQAKAAAETALAEAQRGVALNNLTLPGLVQLPGEGVAPPSPDALDRTAPRVESTGLFARASRDVPRIGVVPSLSNLAFNDLSVGQVHNTVIEANGRYFVVRLKSREEADPAKMKEARAGLVAQAQRDRAPVAVEQFTDELLAKASIVKTSRLLAE